MLIPGPLKKLIAIFRGDVAPILIVLSVMLGFWFGMMPGWQGLHVGILVIALVLNVNLGMFLFFAGLGKALMLATAPLMYHLGEWVQNTLGWWIDLLASIPILAITDFARYAVAAGAFLGPLIGLVLGIILANAVSTFRRTWLKLDEGSEKFHAFHSKWWVKLLDKVLIGKSAKNIKEVLTRKPKWIRKVGVVAAVAVIGLSASGARLAEDGIVTPYVANGLTQTNGAEVNIDNLDFRPFAGSVTLTGVQATDPDQPANNRLVVGEVAGTISWWDLLFGRVRLREVKLSDVQRDQPRQTPGSVLPKSEWDVKASFDAAKLGLQNMTLAQLEGYFKDFKQYDRRLRQLREWLPDRQAAEKKKKEVPQEYLEFLAARAPTPPAARVIVDRIELDRILIADPQFGNSQLTFEFLSDAPTAAGLAVRITAKSHDQPTELEVTFHYDNDEGGATIRGRFDQVSLKEFQSRLSDNNPVRFKDGIAMCELSGFANTSTIDFAAKVKTQGMKLDSTGGVLGMDPGVTNEVMKVLENIETTLRIAGPYDQPRLALDSTALQQEFQDALVAAGKNQVANQLNKLAADQGIELEGAKVLDDPLKAGGELIGGFLNQSEKKEK